MTENHRLPQANRSEAAVVVVVQVRTAHATGGQTDLDLSAPGRTRVALLDTQIPCLVNDDGLHGASGGSGAEGAARRSVWLLAVTYTTFVGIVEQDEKPVPADGPRRFLHDDTGNSHRPCGHPEYETDEIEPAGAAPGRGPRPLTAGIELFDLTGKTALGDRLVAGDRSCAGRRGSRARGARVVLNGRDETKLAGARARLAETGGRGDGAGLRCDRPRGGAYGRG